MLLKDAAAGQSGEPFSTLNTSNIGSVDVGHMGLKELRKEDQAYIEEL